MEGWDWGAGLSTPHRFPVEIWSLVQSREGHMLSAIFFFLYKCHFYTLRGLGAGPRSTKHLAFTGQEPGPSGERGILVNELRK